MSTYDVVRVARLNDSHRRFDGTDAVSRPPQIGDIGTIVFDIDQTDVCEVECVNCDGLTLWLAEFHVTELERIDEKRVEWNQLPADVRRITLEVSIGMTRREVVSVLGEPDSTGGTSRKHLAPSIFRYGNVELHFEQPTDGKLQRVVKEDEAGVGIVLLD